jgi:hypothetical protein
MGASDGKQDCLGKIPRLAALPGVGAREGRAENAVLEQETRRKAGSPLYTTGGCSLTERSTPCWSRR